MHELNRTTAGEASALVRRVNTRHVLSPEDIRILESLQADTRSFPPKSDILREGQPFQRVIVFRSGWAFAYKSLSDGRRQIVNFLLPGDHVGLFGHFPRIASTSIGCLTPVEIAEVPPADMDGALRRSEQLMSAFGWMVGQDLAFVQEQVVRLGRRSARERTAHLLLELCQRLGTIGRIGDHYFQLPLSQVELSDMLGLSGVHMNRTLRALRKEGLIDVQRRWIRITDVERMAEVADYREIWPHEFQVDEGPEAGSDVTAS